MIMKKASILIIMFFFTFILNIYSNENNNVLQAGYVKPISYTLNGHEMVENVRYMEVILNENGLYEIEVGTGTTEFHRNESTVFYVESIIEHETKIIMQLSNIMFYGSNVHVNGHNGKININKNTNIVTIEITLVFYDPRGNLIEYLSNIIFEQ